MQELTFEEIEQVDGGIIFAIAAGAFVVDCFLIGVMIGMQQEM
ncbi:class IIb bacteriocin, lactobin A/cerein 7B family [Shewanella sp. A14]